MKAHAAVAVEPRRVEYREVDVPEPGPDDVVVRITHSWISNGTEGSFVRGERIAGDTPIRPTDPSPFPHVSGYQKVGVIQQVGANVTDLAIGETVFATVSRIDGMFYDHGGHISPAVTHRSQIWKLPAGIDPVAFSGLVLTQVGYNVGARPTVDPGNAAVVIGDGMVGHWSAQTLRHRGARVLMLGRHPERLAKFVCGDGDKLVNEKEVDVAAVVREWAPEGVRVVADTVGSIATVNLLMPLLCGESHISSAGFYGPNGKIDIQDLRQRETTLHAPSGWSQARMDTTLDLVARGVLQTLPLITHRFPATRAGEAFDLILSRSEPVLGVVLDWE